MSDDKKIQWTLDLIQKLLDANIGESIRLEIIKNTLAEGTKISDVDKDYLKERFNELQEHESSSNIVKENQTDSKITKVSEQPKENLEESKPEEIDTKDTIESEIDSDNKTTEQPTEIEKLRKEIHKLQDKNYVIEEHLKNQENQKLRLGNAIGGVILMAIGLVMVVGGGAAALDSMCIGQTSYGFGGSCRSDFLSFMVAGVFFWIGMIPTIFGVRLVAKA